MERRSFLKNTGLAGILAAGSAPAFAQTPDGQVALRVELPEVASTRSTAAAETDRRSASATSPAASSRSRCSRPAKSFPACRSPTPCRTAPSSAATPRRITTSARIRRSRSARAIPFGMNAAPVRTPGGTSAAARRSTTNSLKDYGIIVDPVRQHRRADGRLVPQGDQDRRRSEGSQVPHRRLCRARC